MARSLNAETGGGGAEIPEETGTTTLLAGGETKTLPEGGGALKPLDAGMREDGKPVETGIERDSGAKEAEG